MRSICPEENVPLAELHVNVKNKRSVDVGKRSVGARKHNANARSFDVRRRRLKEGEK